tara:strand:- start:11293 stop:13080 length:1788 start_codon:yes stop_codon:yes gene_type:complete
MARTVNLNPLKKQMILMTEAIEAQTNRLMEYNRIRDNNERLEKRALKLKEKQIAAEKDLEKVQEKGLRRTQILNNTLAKNGDVLKLGLKSMRDYVDEGGTRLEYLAHFLTGTSEKIRLFGIEAVSARRFMYGFLPPGMFRMVNKIATAFNGFGSTMRAFKGQSEGANNALTTMGKIWKKTLGFKPLEFDFGPEGDEKAMAKAEKKRNKKINKESRKNLKKQIEQQIKAQKELERLQEAHSLKSARKLSEEGKGKKNYTRAETERFETAVANRNQQSKTFRGRQKKLELAKKERKRLSKQLEKAKAQSPMGKLRKKALKLFNGIGTVLKNVLMGASKFFMVTMLTLLGLLLIVKTVGPVIKDALTTAWQAIQVPLGLIQEAFGMIWEGISGIFNAFFGDGSLDSAIDSMITLGLGLLQLAGAFIWAAVQFIGVLAIKLVVGLWDKFWVWIKKFYSSGNKVAKTVLLVVVVLGMVIAAIMGAPILMIIGIGILLYKVGKWIIKQIPGFSEGGVSKGGLAVVGEKGPELVSMKKGTRVHSNADSKKMVANSGGTSITNNFKITINAKDTSDAELRRIADKVGEMVNKKINRQLGMSIL